ncbi:hypothetical protein GFS60_07636 (plasmid) [Rhodococcus sp. WAY2]|nr:hypothetical protein GFS60_07636 [Rhodococcus sp. WAY2]
MSARTPVITRYSNNARTAATRRLIVDAAAARCRPFLVGAGEQQGAQPVDLGGAGNGHVVPGTEQNTNGFTVILTAWQRLSIFCHAQIFTGVDLAIDRGSRVVVLGLNGAGKTTLFCSAASLASLGSDLPRRRVCRRGHSTSTIVSPASVNTRARPIP